MKTKLTILLLALALLTVSAQQKPQQWEYKVQWNCSEQKANTLGAEGWELVAIGGSGSGATSNVTEYVFKRAR